MSKKSDSKLVEHARRELEMAGTFNKTDNYDGGIGRAVLAMIKTADSWAQGNGQKLEATVMAFNQVVNGALLTPPTTNPAEWDVIDGAAEGTVRNKRCPFYVSTDGGKTWMHLESKQRGTSRDHLTGKDSDDGAETTDGTGSTESATGTASDERSGEATGTDITQTTEGTVPPDGEAGASEHQGSSESEAQPDGSGLDPGVASESKEASGGTEKPAQESKTGEA